MQERIAPFGATKEQKEWLESESKLTGESIASVLRGLIQGNINAK